MLTYRFFKKKSLILNRIESHGTIFKLFRRVKNKKNKPNTNRNTPPFQSCPPNTQFPFLETVDIIINIPFQEISLKNSIVQGMS